MLFLLLLCAGVPNAVWTVKRSVNDEFDAYIVVSFVNATLVLSIGETVEEVSDSGFLGTVPSLSVSLLGDDSLMQVSHKSLCPSQVFLGSEPSLHSWQPPVTAQLAAFHRCTAAQPPVHARMASCTSGHFSIPGHVFGMPQRAHAHMCWVVLTHAGM